MPHAVHRPDRVQNQMSRLADIAGDVPVIVSGATPDPELLAAYAEAGLGHLALTLPTQPRTGTLRMLDAFASLVADHR
jgi:hypothetical protein